MTMRNRAVRAGVAGAGLVAYAHVDAIRRAGAEVAAISSSSPDRARAAAGRLGLDAAVTTSDELVTRTDVDVVHICTPNALHASLAERAIAAGKHVICEKPLTTSAAAARQLTAQAHDAGVASAVPFVYRYHPMAAEARHRLRAGGLGAVRLIHGHYLQDWLADPADDNWRVRAEIGGPSRAFADIGSHWCDLAEWITGHKITEVCAAAQTVLARGGADVDTEDTAQLIFGTDRGAMGTLVVSQISPGRKNRLWIEIDAAHASVVFDQEQPDTLAIGRRERTEIVPRHAPGLGPRAAGLSVLPAGHPMGYLDCFAALVAEVYADVRAGAPSQAPPYPTFADATRMVALTEAVLTSARTRSWTEVPR